MPEQYQTLAEMKERYPNEWVLIGRPKLDRYQDVTGGHVLFHTADRLEMDRHMLALPDEACTPMMACRYMGEPVYPEVWDRPEFLDEDAELRQAQ
ncbi:MAG TPA: hypothetical protein VD866_10365 [Urbifossiella sp.]|nr:hypothetical protein [Urbifossiella sp.]